MVLKDTPGASSKVARVRGETENMMYCHYQVKLRNCIARYFTKFYLWVNFLLRVNGNLWVGGHPEHPSYEELVKKKGKLEEAEIEARPFKEEAGKLAQYCKL